MANPSEAYLSGIIEFISSENLIFGSDYPHIYRQPDVVKNVVELEENLSQEIVKKIVWDNPKCFYKV
ncbi:amidohydrolase family protein [Okeania sp. SIO2B3]|uniref:amidohydrolase family protein n=1 Tax=Okeania sp. SIO2B3 TaxID=2607784 RepID=UPI0013C22556|nr:amidohydrolase family protein [Okeania sp. SIO2B3]NET42259.1 amidohydrolase family protein [Okeania sp. SIO2B3]